MKKALTIIIILSLFIMNSCQNRKITVTYPETKKIEQTDNYFGTNVEDPYRWLENDTSAETEAWVNAENAVTKQYLDKITFRPKLKQRLTDLTNYEKYGTPFKKHGKYYFFKNDGLQNQSVLYVIEKVKENESLKNAEATVLLDPNKLSDDGTVALTGITFSKNGKYLAYTISRSGSDWTEIYVMDLASKTLLTDHIKWAKFTSASWHKDGFYYSAYDVKEDGSEYSTINEYHKIYYHKIGTSQTDDKLVFENKNYPKRFYYCGLDEDERALFIYEGGAGLGDDLYMKNLTKENSPIVKLTNNLDKTYSPIAVLGDRILILTNDGAKKYKIVETTFDKPEQKYWKDFVPETENVLEGASVIGGKLFLEYQIAAASHIFRCDLETGKIINEIDLPSIGSAGISGDKDEDEAFITFTSFAYPTTIYQYSVSTNDMKLFRQADVKFNPEDYIVEQVFYPSVDGTEIPMFIIYKKGIKKDGNNPLLVYGYGGFNVSLNPSFSTSRIPFLENGGIYVAVNLRGGGEFGEEWHTAGIKMNKQNVFDDFISAAEYLQKEKYTSPSKTACMGGSNGGLLIGAVVNQRSDLFAVAIPQVGVMDMLRYHKFTIGWNWASDYGTSEDSKEMFEYLYKYSPLHSVKPTDFPAMLITTADHDDRVVPAHSFKYAATVQANNIGSNPTLIRIETKAGHGSGKPISKQLEEQADIWGFIMWNLGMNVK